MNRSRSYTKEPLMSGSQAVWIAIILALLTVVCSAWLGGQVAGLVLTGGFLSGSLFAGVTAMFDATQGWGEALNQFWYWVLAVPVTAVLAAAAFWVAGRGHRWFENRPQRAADIARRPGMASARDVNHGMGTASLMKQAKSLRPGLVAVVGAGVRPQDIGFSWGVCNGAEVWTSVRDSVVLLGPSGAGKTAFVVVPRILDAPGALIVTSIRPDVLTPTFEVRKRIGPVMVLAADGSISGLPSVMGWSPIRGAEDGETAQIRAKVLAAGTAGGVENGGFFEAKTEQILMALLHSAALGNRDIHTLWQWTTSPSAATEAVDILTTDRRAEPGWGFMLKAMLEGDPRTLQNVWAGVGIAFSGMNVAAVRERFNPAPGANFDPVRFLQEKGTLYLLVQEGHPAGRMLAALIADVARTAKMMADASLGNRLDPPLTLLLDEVANFGKLPDLPAWVSGFGGSGVIVFVVIQGLAQLRERWGADAAASIWQAATTKVLLGGITDADDLKGFSALTGMMDEATWSESKQSGPGGGSTSSSIRQVPVMDEQQIRALQQGTALMFYKGNPPALTRLTAYFERPEAAELQAHREYWESIVQEQAGSRLTSHAQLPPVQADPIELSKGVAGLAPPLDGQSGWFRP